MRLIQEQGLEGSDSSSKSSFVGLLRLKGFGAIPRYDHLGLEHLLVEQLCRLVAETLKVDPCVVGPQTGPINLLQWDSFNHVHLVVAIEETYGVQLSNDEITSLFSVSDIATLLKNKGIHTD